ncbi:MAG TPA: carbohydrate-binding protein [Actinocrinis sp.]|nr:carbohydrate-binding protein [Actinocrinis sp.]
MAVVSALALIGGPTVAHAATGSPYGGTAAAVPGTVQAENYDTGGQGVAYNVATVNGSGNNYRSDGVDLEATTDTGGGYDVGWTAAGQWFNYTVNAASAGSYTVSVRLASPNGVTDGLHIANSSGTNLSGSINVPATGGWQTWTTVTASVTLPAGTQTLTLNQDNGGWNINYLTFASNGSNEGPFNGTAAPVPGTVQAENYDTGGQGVAYNVTSTNGSANSYRPDGVDLEATTDTGGGDDVGWTAAGQWFKYTVNVASAGTYSLGVRLASPNGVTDGLHIANSSGTNLSGNINVPATGGWQTWTTVTASVTLPAGTQTLTLNQDNGGWNINYLSFGSAGINTSAWYEVVNQNSGLCASAANGGTASGTAVEQLSCTGASSQLWQFVPVATGEYEVLNQNAQGAGEAWNITGGVTATASGALLQMWAYGGTSNTNELFAANQQSNGNYTFVADNSGLCIDTPGASTTSGVQLEQYTCNGTAAQAFSLVVPSGGCGNSCGGTPNFGPNVYVFDPSMSSATIQNDINSVFNSQQSSEMGTGRYAMLFKPGSYNVDVPVGFYTQVLGLGQSPTQTTITGGGVHADANWNGGNATINFWRDAENLTDSPSSGNTVWATSQATPLRRMDINGSLALSLNGYSSGGFVGDSVVTGQVSSGSQQQYMLRNDQFGSWTGSNWNMVFTGSTGVPGQSFPNPPFTTVNTTPNISEKPYLYVDSSGNWNVFVPGNQANRQGASWSNGNTPGSSLPISSFFIANPSNTVAQINAALAAGQNLLFTPGIYQINGTINVTNPDTVVLGLGLATLVSNGGNTILSTADVNGIRIGGLIFDAGTTNSQVLVQIGPPGSSASHASDPTVLSDVFARIGGATVGSANQTLVVNSNNVIGDDLWLWRADHGNGGTVGWNTNTAANGLVVNGANVAMYGLAVEHYQQVQVQWNGSGGKDYFYQSEMPYDPPNQSAWMDGSARGYPSFAVSGSATGFQGYGLGVYCFFSTNNSVVSDNAFTSSASGANWHDLVTVSITNAGAIENIINGVGGPTPTNTSANDLTSYP